MSQTLFRRRLIGVVSLPLLLMMLLAGVSIWQISRLLYAMQWVEHTDQAIAQANQVQRLFTETESSVRGYLLTGESTFLNPYEQAAILVQPSLQSLITFVSDNPAQVQRLTQVQARYLEWSQYTPTLIALQQRDEAAAKALVETRNELMGKIRDQMLEFVQVEEQLRNTRTRTVRQTTRIIIGSSVVLSLALGLILAYFIRRQILAMSYSYEQALKLAQEQTKVAQQSAQRLESLHEIDRAILSAQSIEALAHESLSRLKQAVTFEQGAVMLCNFDSQEAWILAGQLAGETAGSVIPLADWTSPDTAQANQPIRYARDIAALTQRPPLLETLLAEGYRSLLAVAMQVENQLIGDLSLLSSQVDAFCVEEQEVAREVADQLAIAIQQSRLRQQLQGYATDLERRVTERTAQLQAVNEELEAFSYTIAHDLSAPLRGIEGYATALQEDYGNQLDAIAQNYIQQVFVSIDRMSALVQDLLTYSRLSREAIQLAPINLEQALEEAQFQLAAELRERNAEIRIQQPLPRVMGHRTILPQMLTNLLSNAAKFTAPGVTPQIEIGAETTGDRVCLWMKDNGIGIEPQYQEQIFGVFERLHGRDTYPGTGIGLAIVRKGAERLGGQVGLESKPAQGSRFWIELQAVQP